MPQSTIVTIIRPPARPNASIPTQAPRRVIPSGKTRQAPTPSATTAPATIQAPQLQEDAVLPAVLQTKLLFSVTEAACLLSLSRGKTYELVRDGRLHHVKIDASIRIAAQDLAAFVHELRAAS